MAFESYVGSFALNTSTGSQTITGVGFTPKFLLLIFNRMTADGSTADAFCGVGLVESSTAERSWAFDSEDAAASMDTTHVGDASACIHINSPGSTTTDDGVVDFTSFNSDGFVINVSSAPAAAYRVGFIALGGTDILNVKVGTVAMPSGTGNTATTGIGFQPDFLMTLCHGHAVEIGTDATWSLGMTDGTNEMAVGITAGNGDADSVTNRWMNAKTLSQGHYDNEAVDAEATLVSFDADGWTLNYSATVSGDDYIYAAIEHSGNMYVGDMVTKVSTGSQAETGVGFQPDAGFFLSHQDTNKTGTWAAGAKLSLGMTDGTNYYTIGITDEDAQASADCDSHSNDAYLYQSFDYAQTQTGAASLTSWDSDGFTLNQVDADPSAYQLMYWVFGAAGTVYEESPVGSFTPSGSVSRETDKAPAGSFTPSGGLSRTALKALAGVLALAGTLARAGTFARSLAGTLALSGATARTTTKVVFSGSLGLAGVVDTAYLFYKTVAGAIGLAGAITDKAISKGVAGVLTPAGALARLTSKTFSGSLGLSGDPARLFGRLVAGVLTPTGDVSKLVKKSLTGTLGLAGIITRLVTSLASLLLSNAATYTVTVSDAEANTVSLSDAVTNTVVVTETDGT